MKPAPLAYKNPCKQLTEMIAEIKHHRQQQALIADLSERLRTLTQTTEMIEMILQKSMRYFNSSSAAILIDDPTSRNTRVHTAFGQFKPLEGKYLPVGRGLVSKAITQLKTYWTNNVFCDPYFMEEYEHIYHKAEAVIPLKTDQAAVGALVIGRDDPFSSWDIKNLEALTNLTANALQRAFTFEELNRSVAQLSILHEIDTLITGESHTDSIVQKVFQTAAAQFLVDIVRLYEYQENTHFSTLLADSSQPERPPESLPSTQIIGEQALINQKPLTLFNLSQVDEKHHESSQALLNNNLHWYHIIPLVSRSKTIGFLECIHHQPFYPNQNWQKFMNAFGEQLVIVFEGVGLINQLEQVNHELTTAYDKTLAGWAKALELRDHETKNHSTRVTVLSEQIARKMGVPEKELIHIRRGALLHDIGKIAIPDQILLKPGQLDPQEWALMRTHPQIGYEMLAEIEYLQPALDIPLYHHERWDGTGYPFGISGEDIPLAARIFALVDVWDALTSDRPYRAAWQKSRAYEYILSQAGKHFDPQVVKCFQQLYAHP